MPKTVDHESVGLSACLKIFIALVNRVMNRILCKEYALEPDELIS